MSNIEQFVSDAIAGGWRKDEKPDLESNNDGYSIRFLAGHDTHTLWEADILIDPLAWQAVGRTRGWRLYDDTIITTYRDPENKHRNVHQRIALKFSWRWYMHEFVSHLADGLSIEEALGKL